MRYIIPLILLIFLIGCSKSSEKRNSSKVSIKIERLEEKLLRCSSREEVSAFLKQYPFLSKGFFGSGRPGEESQIAGNLFELIDNPHFDTLFRETQNTFPDLSGLEAQFSEAFSNLEDHYPEFEPPKVYSIVSGLTTDLFISDSVILISLDFYMGQNAKYKPLGYPEYISRRFESEFIVPSIMIFMSDKYSKTDLNDKSMLAEMIYYGKAYAFARKMLPEVHDSLIVWYTEKELKDVKAHEDIVWAHFIQNELLYESNQRIKQKYLSERPKTLEIGNECPGRVGAWLGWEIVQRYQEKEDDFIGLMNETNATTILKQSAYKPDPR